MGKLKIKKSDIWIDMTPMSDVMVLLLTFFMLTSTFVKNTPVKVVTPGSGSEIKVPEKDLLTITINNDGKVFMSMDNVQQIGDALSDMTGRFGVELTNAQVARFLKDPQWGISMELLPTYLNLDDNKRPEGLRGENGGIPTDSIEQGGVKGKSEFQFWVDAVKAANEDIKIAIQADEKTPYKVVKQVMSELQDMSENRYYLITSLKKEEE